MNHRCECCDTPLHKWAKQGDICKPCKSKIKQCAGKFDEQIEKQMWKQIPHYTDFYKLQGEETL